MFLRQAIRQGIGVTIAVLLGYAIADTLGGSQQKTGVQWLQGCKWAAITVVVVASPMLGKVSQVGAYWTMCTSLSTSTLSVTSAYVLPLHFLSVKEFCTGPLTIAAWRGTQGSRIQGKQEADPDANVDACGSAETPDLVSSLSRHSRPRAGIHGTDDRDCMWRVAGAWDLASRARLWTRFGHALHRSEPFSRRSLLEHAHWVGATIGPTLMGSGVSSPVCTSRIRSTLIPAPRKFADDKMMLFNRHRSWLYVKLHMLLCRSGSVCGGLLSSHCGMGAVT